MSVPSTCQMPPPGWCCSRPGGHDGPCPADEVVKPGDSVVFLQEPQLQWLARAATADNRYVLLTTVSPLTEEEAEEHGLPVGSRQVRYTVIDWHAYRRGALNVIGGGLGIETTSGPDEQIAEAIAMLSEPGGGWELSHRNWVRLAIARVDRVSGP